MYSSGYPTIFSVGSGYGSLVRLGISKEQISRTPYELPKLNINTEFWPYEGGECGVGPLDAVAVFESFKDENFCKCLLEEDIQLGNCSHNSILSFNVNSLPICSLACST